MCNMESKEMHNVNIKQLHFDYKSDRLPCSLYIQCPGCFDLQFLVCISYYICMGQCFFSVLHQQK